MSGESEAPHYYELSRTDVLELIPPECNTVLEVGCAFGALGRALKQRGTAVDGIELNPRATPFLEQCYRKIWIGDVEALDLSGIRDDYDCIVFADVLEHLVHPEAVLDRLTGFLRGGGTVVASVPNIRNFAILYRLVVNGTWTYEESGILDKTHLRFFTRLSIAQMFEARGFSIDQWAANVDRHRGVKGVVARFAGLFVPELNVSQFLVRATKP